jgi:hypothetical protein
MEHSIDDLLTECRTDRARIYLREAVDTFQAGNYRSCIIATWIAIVFDFVDKLRELSDSNDANATSKLQTLEHARQNDNHARLLAWERDVLEWLKDPFEIVSATEWIDLQRLKDDRNRCAHPTFQADDLPFVPSKALAWAHLDSAVRLVLSQAPTHGQRALSIVMDDVDRESFPMTADLAKRYLSAGPLGSPRPSLITNVVSALTKLLVQHSNDERRQKRQVAALTAIYQMREADVDDKLRQSLPLILQSLSDEQLPNVLRFLRDCPFALPFPGDPAKIRIRKYIEHCAQGSLFETCRLAIQIPGLDKYAVLSTKRLDLDDFGILLTEYPHLLIDESLKRLNESSDWKETNRIGEKLILPHVELYSAKQRRKLVDCISKNEEVGGSFVAPRILRELIRLDQENGLSESKHYRRSLTSSPRNLENLLKVLDSETIQFGHT